MKKLWIVIIPSILVAGAILSISARGGKHNTLAGTCLVTPNPVSVDIQFMITGSKYGAGQGLTLAVISNSGTSYVWTVADNDGNFSTTSRVYAAGVNIVKVHASLGGALLGSCSFNSI